MTADNPTPNRESDSARIEAAEDAEMLKELAQIGMRLVRLVEANAEARMAENPAADLGQVDQAFARISRSIRQTLALKAKLADLKAKWESLVEKQEQTQQADASRSRWRKVKLGRAVAETIEAEAGEHDAENLLSDLHERLEDPDIEADLALRSMGEMVASVCDDLGLPRNGEVWEGKGWYLTEGWHACLPKPEPAGPEPELPWAERVAPYLAEMDRLTCPSMFDAPTPEAEPADDNPVGRPGPS